MTMSGNQTSVIQPQARQGGSLGVSSNSVAMAEASRTRVQAMFQIARQNPRNMLDVRHRILESCRRPAFAQTARYSKPIGGGKQLTGASIRLMEECIRAMGSIITETLCKYDDEAQRLISVIMTDLETNTTYSKDVIIEKSVERSFVRDGQVVLGQRANSSGRTVFNIVASDDELQIKEGALVSKCVRGLAERIVPRDIIDEALAVCAEVSSRDDATDPTAAIKRVADAFGKLGVRPSELQDFIGHDLQSLSKAEIGMLRDLHAGITSGETIWADVVAAKREAAGDSAEGQPATPKAVQKVMDSAKARFGMHTNTAPTEAVVAAPVPTQQTQQAQQVQQPQEAQAVEPEATQQAAHSDAAANGGRPRAQDYVKNAEEWQMFCSNSDEKAIAREYNVKSSAFNRANVRDERRKTALSAIQAILESDGYQGDSSAEAVAILSGKK